MSYHTLQRTYKKGADQTAQIHRLNIVHIKKNQVFSQKGLIYFSSLNEEKHFILVHILLLSESTLQFVSAWHYIKSIIPIPNEPADHFQSNLHVYKDLKQVLVGESVTLI